MNQVNCPVCGNKCIKAGKTKAGSQRWLCRKCNSSVTHKIDNSAKELQIFLDWLFGKESQSSMPGDGRTFRRKTAKYWNIWPMPPKVEDSRDVLYLDGIYLGRKACILICCDDKYVLGWYLCREEHQKREIWTAETLMHALEVCDDDILALAINLSFACSLRMGEMLGLTWDCIDISEESLKENNASIFVDKELQRVNRDVMEVLDNKDIIRVFPRTLSNTNTSLVLKTPKTKTSVRKIFLPSTVAQMLLERKKQIDEMKELFGDEYLDYDLVFCHSSGRPMEGQVINRALKKLIQDNDLPDVVFHSFRHASITYKLKWNGGDMKSVQGDSGHARMDMVADVYSHIIDEDRRYNAQKFEEQFYNAKGLKNAEEGKTAPMPKFETSVELLDPMAEVQKESEVEKEKPAENSTDENAALLTKLLSNPETAALLKALAKTI